MTHRRDARATDGDTAEVSSQPDGSLTGPGREVPRRLLVGVILAGTLSVLDSTIVVPLLTTIAADLGLGSEASWLVSAYLLASTVTIPAWGRWLDLRGERTPFWVALSLFSLGTVAAMLAPDFAALVAARVIQGIGAGGVVPLGQAILAGRVDSTERAHLQIHYNVAYGIAAGAGPLIGGALVAVSWRWAFAVVLPFCAVVAWCLRGQLRAVPRRPGALEPFDWWGSALVTVGLTGLLLGVERGVAWLAALGGLVLLLFIRRSLRHPRGLVPRALLTNRVVLACTGAAVLVGFVQFSFLTYLPALSQQTAPDLNPGLVVVPLTILWVTAGAFTAVLALRTGTRVLAVAAALLGTVAGLIVAVLTAYPSLLIAGVLVGAAAGLTLIPSLLLAQHAADGRDVGATTSLLVLLRNAGAALGVAITAVVLADRGSSAAFILLAVVAACGLIPALTMPGARREATIRRAADLGG